MAPAERPGSRACAASLTESTDAPASLTTLNLTCASEGTASRMAAATNSVLACEAVPSPMAITPTSCARTRACSALAALAFSACGG